jgi:F0F1-type ATP synthase delta subunit
MNASAWKNLAYQAFKLAEDTDALSWQKMFEDLLAHTSLDDCLTAQNLDNLLKQGLKQITNPFSPDFVDFIHLVIKKKCIKQIDNIYHLFAQLLFLGGYSLIIAVETPHQLSKTLKVEIEAKLISYYGTSNIIIKYLVIHELLGGIRICTPLGIMDHSMKYKLQMMSVQDKT